MDNFYSRLNTAQKRAVDTIDGPVLVLAGPGTGKTQLLSARVANILDKTDTPAESILCLTFTDNGARNMRDRLSSLIKDDAYKVEINTYHGFSQTIISQNREYFLDQNLLRALDDITKFEIMSSILETLPPNNILKRMRPKDLISTISEFKQALITPEQLVLITKENQSQLETVNSKISSAMNDFKIMPRNYEKARVYFEDIYKILNQYALEKSVLEDFEPLLQIGRQALKKALIEAEEIQKTKPLTRWKNNFLEKKDNKFVYKDNFNLLRLENMIRVYNQYTARLVEAGLYDFDDMILNTIKAMTDNPDLKYNLQEKYLYILLDEYQDTNLAQSRIIELLTDNPINEGRPNVMAVGDDDQAIFSFQGARFSNMIDFYKQYRQTELINLSENYRSHSDILTVAENVAAQIEDRLINNLSQVKLSKKLTAANTKIKSSEICRYDFANSLSENSWLTQKIVSLKAAGENLNEIAILAPKHKFLESLAPYLANSELPIRYEKSENSLDNPGVQLVIGLAKLVIALEQGQPHNHLLFEVLSYPVWKIELPLIWKLSWTANRQKSWLDHILTNDDFKSLRPLGLWLMQLAIQVKRLSLAANFDLLIGNSDLEIKDGEVLSRFASPIKAYYAQANPKQQIDFMLDINLLRENYMTFVTNHKASDSSPLEQLVKMIGSYEQADQKMARTNSYNENAEAVNLMTVFGAKGLEFKHVFLLETNDNTWGKSRSSSNTFTLPDNLQPIRHDTDTLDEKARLFFVAITRAKSHLYLLNSLASLTGKPTNRLRFLSEVESEAGFKSMALPESQAEVQSVPPQPTFNELSLNLSDNFSDWQSRHYNGRLEYQDLLQPRLDRFKLSATSLNNYTNLTYSGPASYFLMQILGFPGAYSIRAIYGTAIHYTLEQIMRESEQTGAKAIQIYKQKLTDFDLSSDDLTQLIEWGRRSLPKFVSSRPEIFKPMKDIKVETEVDFRTRNVVFKGARLTGKIDRAELNTIEKTITIVDFKTGKSQKELSLSDPGIYHNLKQLYFYYVLATNSTAWPGYTIANWRLEFVDPDHEGQINYLTGEFEPELLTRVQKLIQAVWQKTMALDFTEPEVLRLATLKDVKDFETDLISEI